MKIGDKIKARRIELGMTQQELADKMGYTNRSSICSIETGREVNLTAERIGEFAKVLKLEPIELLGDKLPDIIIRPDEMDLIIRYRSADVQTREMINRILAYGEKMNE